MAYCVIAIESRKGPQCAGRREDHSIPEFHGGSMIRRSCIALFVALTLACSSVAIHAQTKAAPARPLSIKPLDINTASEEDIMAVGIEKATAKKIVENRPYRNKTELVSR